MQLTYEAITDIGGRESNQDFFLCKEVSGNYLWVVCDGLGAHSHSDLAAQYFCEGLEHWLPSYYPKINENPSTAIQNFLQAGHQWMSEKLVEKDAFDAKTTCALAYLNDQHSVFAHLGDSRIYRILDGHSIWQSLDHTMAQQMVDSGKLSESVLNTHPSRNLLIYSLI